MASKGCKKWLRKVAKYILRKSRGYCFKILRFQDENKVRDPEISGSWDFRMQFLRASFSVFVCVCECECAYEFKCLYLNTNSLRLCVDLCAFKCVGLRIVCIIYACFCLYIVCMPAHMLALTYVHAAVIMLISMLYT